MRKVDRPVRKCSKCGQLRKTATITPLGAYCHYCYKNFLVPKACATCGRSTRAEPRAKKTQCATCRRTAILKTLRCQLCKKPITGIEKHLPDGGVVGPCCYYKVAPLRKCGYCGRLAKHCSRAVSQGIHRTACGPCRQKRMPKCENCGFKRHTYPTQEGRKLCRQCFEGRPPAKKKCIECGHLSRTLSHKRCVYHAWRFHVPKTVARLATGVKQAWVKDLFKQYANTLLDGVGSSRCIPGYLRADIAFFGLIDSAFASPKELTNVNVVLRLGKKSINRHRRAVSFLVSAGHIGSMNDTDVQIALIPWRTRTVRQLLTEPWMERLIDQFLAELLARRALLLSKKHKRTREPIAAASIAAAVKGAARLLAHAAGRGVTSPHAIKQSDVTSFLAKTPVLPQHIARFIAFLNTCTKRFTKLTLPQRSIQTGLPDGLLSERAHSRLVAAMFRTRSHRDTGYALLALFCLLYAQPVDKARQMRSTQLRPSAMGWEARFAKQWVLLDEALTPMIALWLSKRRESSVTDRTGASEYLFPGRKTGFPITTDTLHSWLSQYGVKPQQLQSSGLASLVRDPDFHPRVAIDGLGVKSSQVTRYMSALGSAELHRAGELVRASAKASVAQLPRVR